MPQPSPRTALGLARFTAICRLAIGAGFVAYPPLTIRVWIGADAGRPAAVLLARALGARDLIIGAGTLAQIGSGRQLAPWLRAALVADATDFLLTILDRDATPDRGRITVAAIAAGGVVLGAGALVTLRDER